MRYYVSMVEPEGQRRKWLLAGPYATEEEAVAAKPHVVRLADEIDGMELPECECEEPADDHRDTCEVEDCADCQAADDAEAEHQEHLQEAEDARSEAADRAEDASSGCPE